MCFICLSVMRKEMTSPVVESSVLTCLQVNRGQSDRCLRAGEGHCCKIFKLRTLLNLFLAILLCWDLYSKSLLEMMCNDRIW